MPTSQVPPLAVAAAVATAATSTLLIVAAVRGVLAASHLWSSSRVSDLDVESRQLDQLGALLVAVLAVVATVVGVVLVIAAGRQARPGVGSGSVLTAAALHVPLALLALRYLAGGSAASGTATFVALAVLVLTGLVWWATYDRRCGAWRRPTATNARRRPGAFT